MAFGQIELKEGYLNVAHGHFPDGTSKDEFILFDYDHFSQPPIILDLSNYSTTDNLFKLAGQKVKVRGFYSEISSNPVIGKMVVQSIHLGFGATVELDQKVYSWTDKVYITIVAPDKNLNTAVRDTIGGVNDPIKISTQNFDLDNYKMVETGTNTGIFTGEVILSGFVHDSDGDGSADTSPKTLNQGVGMGFIRINEPYNEGITVQYEYEKDETVVGSASIRWNEGELNWLEPSYPSSGSGTIRIVDPDLNLDPDSRDFVPIRVWSDSDSHGIEIMARETNEATGIFTGTVFFGKSTDSSVSRIKTDSGDRVFAQYEDHTLPSPNAVNDDKKIIATTTTITVNPGWLIPTPSLIRDDIPNENSNNLVTVYFQDKFHGFSYNDLRYDHQEFSDIIKIHEPQLPYDQTILPQFNVKVVPLRYSDLPNITPHEKNHYEQVMFKNQNSLSNYFKVHSYQKLKLTGDVMDWQSLPENSEFYENTGSIILHWVAKHAFDQYGHRINFEGPNNILENRSEESLFDPKNNHDDVDALVFIVNSKDSRDKASWALQHPHSFEEGNTVRTAFISFFVDTGQGPPFEERYQKGYGRVAHEFGHFFHWFHTPLLKPHGTYSDPWSLLSGKNDDVTPPGIVAFQKRKANWIEDEKVIHVPKQEALIFKLDYLHNPSNSKEQFLMAEIPFGSENMFYTIEARKQSQFDSLPSNVGLMIYQYKPTGYGEEVTLDNINGDRIAPLTAARQERIRCEPGSDIGCTPQDYKDLALTGDISFFEKNGVKVKLRSAFTDHMVVCVSNNSEKTLPVVNISDHKILKNKPFVFDLEFIDCFSNNRLRNFEYDVFVTFEDELLLEKLGSISQTGFSREETTKVVTEYPTEDNTINVNVIFRGSLGTNQEPISVTKHVVPEFGPFSVLILSVTITIVLLGAKSGLLSKFTFKS